MTEESCSVLNTHYPMSHMYVTAVAKTDIGVQTCGIEYSLRSVTVDFGMQTEYSKNDTELDERNHDTITETDFQHEETEKPASDDEETEECDDEETDDCDDEKTEECDDDESDDDETQECDDDETEVCDDEETQECDDKRHRSVMMKRQRNVIMKRQRMQEVMLQMKRY